MIRNRIACVIPNWNGKDRIGKALDTLLHQHTTAKVTIVVVDNGSVDGSSDYIRANYPSVVIVQHDKNYGFAGGVNGGIRKALELEQDYVALFNNDAVAELNWLDELWKELESRPEAGIATGKLVASDRSHLDSTGEGYSIWGLAFPRGRGEPVTDKYDDQRDIFAASGGASLYRTDVFRQIGLFDDDFFLYYEDLDVSFRAQLAGWKVRYVPTAVAYHDIGATSDKIRGLTRYHTLKNLPWVVWKNVPARYLWAVLPRFSFAYLLFLLHATAEGQGWVAFKAFWYSWFLLPKKLLQRRRIQQGRKVSPAYIWGSMLHDLPPNATRLRSLKKRFINEKRTKAIS
jgi:GT2 family glycosyltransferase